MTYSHKCTHLFLNPLPNTNRDKSLHINHTETDRIVFSYRVVSHMGI